MPTQRDVERLQALREADRRGMLGPVQKSALNEIERRFMQLAEPAMTAASAAFAEPVSGFVGLAALPYGSDVASQAIERTQQAMTYQPRTEGGLQGLQALQNVMAPVGEAFEGASSYLGDAAYEATGSPALGAAAYSVPTAALELLGANIARRIPGRKLEFGDIGKRPMAGKQRGAVGGVTSKADDLGYMGEHRPMTVDQGAATADNLVEAFGDDIYGPNALQFFGSGDPREAQIVRTLKKIKDKPDAKVKVYRGAPKGSSINEGDWVTLSRKVAEDYADMVDGDVVEMEVPARDVTVWADSLMEQGYYPQKTAARYTADELMNMDTDDLDRMAFGVTSGEVKKVSPDDLNVIYDDDLLNPQEAYRKGGKEWAESVDLSEPIKVSIDEVGAMNIEDGHHRYFAAQVLGKPLEAEFEVKGNPTRAILKRQGDM